MQHERNCEGAGDQESEIFLGGEMLLNECPVSYISQISKDFLSLFWDCHNISQGDILCHALPESGCVLDQKNKTMTAFSIIRSEFLQHQKEQMKK